MARRRWLLKCPTCGRHGYSLDGYCSACARARGYLFTRDGKPRKNRGVPSAVLTDDDWRRQHADEIDDLDGE